jgi:signal transduction histidine kinase/ActR/RegA family two-component response regulator
MVPPVCSLDEVLITHELAQRRARAPDLVAENRSFRQLAHVMASHPEEMLETLARLALELCDASSAGVSVLEGEGPDEVFRWGALAGSLARYAGTTCPRHDSPCGVCVDRGAPQLFRLPARHFTALAGVDPAIVEGLVLPFGVEGALLGAIWIVTHDEARKFDAEDVRLMSQLGDFTASALRLTHSARALERSVRDRDHFMATLGHELRNPLAAITFALELLERAGDEDATRRRWREVISRQVRQLHHLVNDLLDVSRLLARKITLNRAPVELAALIAGCVEPLQAMAEAQRVHLELAPAAEPILIVGDAVRLQQITTNLVTNALKYTPPGGRVRVVVRRAEARAEIVVEDTGIGLAPDMFQRIFEPFTQVGSETERSRDGLGLGLTLVRSLAELHGGGVRVESEGRGRGSRFTVHLPLQDGLAAAAPGPSTPPHPRCARKVVIIEDNADVRDGLSALVASYGHHLVVAEDGPSGVATVLGTKPEVVLVDLGLPGLDGFQVARTIRSALGDRVFLAAVSGYGTPDDQRRAREAGFNAHLIKPVTADAVQRLLEGEIGARPEAVRASGEAEAAR